MALAAPITRDGFSFAGDSFSVCVSGHLHRRYTLPELKAHFKSTRDGKDQPCHWYEAQLIHYGLQPSRVKGTAKMRLMEAVGAGKMAVPASLSALERELRRDWNKMNKAALAAAAKTPSSGRPKMSGTNKRKTSEVHVSSAAGTSVNVSVTINQDAKPPAKKKVKKAPTSSSSSSTAPPTASSPATAGKQMARRSNPNFGGRINRQSYNQQESNNISPPSYLPSNATSYYDTGVASPPSPPTFARKQTARRGGLILGGRVKREPEVKSESGDVPSDYPPMGTFDGPHASATTYPPLGLINGRYEVVHMGDSSLQGTCVDAYRWLVCTIDGDRLWISFDFRVVHGVMRTESRPRRSGGEGLWFDWCGESPDGRIYDDSHEAKLTFVGDGVIEGIIEFASWSYRFVAERVSGQATRSEVPASQMWDDWNTWCRGPRRGGYDM